MVSFDHKAGLCLPVSLTSVTVLCIAGAQQVFAPGPTNVKRQYYLSDPKGCYTVNTLSVHTIFNTAEFCIGIAASFVLSFRLEVLVLIHESALYFKRLFEREVQGSNPIQ